MVGPLRTGTASGHLRGLVLAAIAGIVGALAAQCFRWALESTTEALFHDPADVTQILPRLPWYVTIALPTVGGAIAGLVLLASRRRTAGHESSVDYLDIIDSRVGRIPLAASLLRCLSSFFSVVSGGSVGKEGAMVQLAATAASALSGKLGGARGDQTQLLIAMAATGGLAAVYHTPLAAAIFIAEIAFGGLGLWRVGMLFIAAVAATWTIGAMGYYTPLYQLPAYHFDLEGRAVLAVVAVGIACGLVGALMLVAIRAARMCFARLHPSLAVRMTAGGLIVGLLLTVAPDVAGNGFAPISTLLSGGTLAEPLVLLLLLKILATAATIGSGAIGGLFTPALLLGALTALAGAPLLAHVTGLSDMTVMLGVVGMAATLSATTHAPLMSTLMVFEMTQEPAFIFPLMLATIVAYVVSNMLGQNGVYAVTAHHLARYARLTRLHDATAGDLMRPPQRLVPSNASLREAREAGLVQKNRFVFLVAPDQRFAGTVSMHELMLLPDDAMAPRLVDMANVDFPVAYAGQKLVDVWETVIESPAERTPVLSDPQERRVVGMLWKSDLLKEAQRLLA